MRENFEERFAILERLYQRANRSVWEKLMRAERRKLCMSQGCPRQGTKILDQIQCKITSKETTIKSSKSTDTHKNRGRGNPALLNSSRSMGESVMTIVLKEDMLSSLKKASMINKTQSQVRQITYHFTCCTKNRTQKF